MDSIGDLLVRIKNGYLAQKRSVVCPASKMKTAVLTVLRKTNYISDFKGKTKDIEIILKYENGKPSLKDVKRVSKPGLRIYSGWESIPQVLSGYGTCIISTSKGIMTGKEARKMKIGGEVICKVW